MEKFKNFLAKLIARIIVGIILFFYIPYHLLFVKEIKKDQKN